MQGCGKTGGKSENIMASKKNALATEAAILTEM